MRPLTSSQAAVRWYNTRDNKHEIEWRSLTSCAPFETAMENNCIGWWGDVNKVDTVPEVAREGGSDLGQKSEPQGSVFANGLREILSFDGADLCGAW